MRLVRESPFSLSVIQRSFSDEESREHSHNLNLYVPEILRFALDDN